MVVSKELKNRTVLSYQNIVYVVMYALEMYSNCLAWNISKEQTIINLSAMLLAYVIVWLAVVFGINSVSNSSGKTVIVRGEAEHYYSFPTCITRTINYKHYS